MKGEYESVKIYKETVREVRKHVAQNGQTITGFVDLAIKEALKKSKKK